MSILEVKALTVRLGRKTIFTDIDMSISRGVTMLLGKNGCGKSTLIRAIAGLIPSKGSVTFEGRDVRRLRPHERAKIFAYLPQKQNTPSGTSVLDYVSLSTAKLFAPPDAAGREAAHAELMRLGLQHIEHRHSETLSGGELRLAGLARARAQKSSIMLMDEPLAGLDFARQHEFIQQACTDDTPMLMSVHDPVIAWQYADDILVMHNGQIFHCPGNDEARFQKLMTLVYGAPLRFEQVGSMRLPIWHND